MVLYRRRSPILVGLRRHPDLWQQGPWIGAYARDLQSWCTPYLRSRWPQSREDEALPWLPCIFPFAPPSPFPGCINNRLVKLWMWHEEWDPPAFAPHSETLQETLNTWYKGGESYQLSCCMLSCSERGWKWHKSGRRTSSQGLQCSSHWNVWVLPTDA